MKTLAFFVLVSLAPLSAIAQSQSGTASWNSGYGSGYGTGSGYAYSPASGYWGYGGRRGCGGTGLYPGWGLGYGFGAGYGGGSLYGGYPGTWGHDWTYGRPYAAASISGPWTPARPVVDRGPELASALDIDEGGRRFRSGDYRGALDSFRSAVAAHPESAVAQAWFAVALVSLGDGRHADKALRSAAAGGLAAGAISLEGMFRDDKERVRMIVALAKVGNEGGLAAAYALALSGEPVRLKQLAEKDPVARGLLPKP
jgi:hypothetical protein